ncbi:hypothetical protein FRB97_006103 [Tulasnella sp. 331]|nr:hypothetical protein FRB97_006103 [Tulasnella sp. 331]
MSGQYQQSEACCTIPPVITEGYKEKGEYKEYAGMRTYFTGPTDTNRTILVFFDIFSFFPQTIQGADIIASSTNSLVIMPDFFRGKTLDPSVYPPRNDEDKEKLGTFFSTVANPKDRLLDVDTIIDALKKEGKTNLGTMGYCWGGKMATLSGATGSFKAVASIHPGLLTEDDAKDLKAPIALFISKDEDAQEAERFNAALLSKDFAAKNKYKLYGTMVHGWAASRANFKDAENLKEYEDVYSRLAEFFNATL